MLTYSYFNLSALARSRARGLALDIWLDMRGALDGARCERRARGLAWPTRPARMLSSARCRVARRAMMHGRAYREASALETCVPTSIERQCNTRWLG